MNNVSVLVSNLPTDPTIVPTLKAVAACRLVYELRDEIVGTIDAESAVEALRRTGAIEKYVKDKEHKATATYAARVLEAAVGAALGPAEHKAGPGRGKKKTIDHDQSFSIRPDDASRFRLMYEHMDVWVPVLEKEFEPILKHMPRREVLKRIEAARRKPEKQGDGEARITQSDAISWLQAVSDADLLLTDPPYSTDVEDIGVFVSNWLPLALKGLKPSARALVFIGAYGNELGAYFSTQLPAGWKWGVPHAWVYRNTIGPTPDYDFVRNWQCVLSVVGPEADKLRTSRINDLLAGFVENAPDGRQDVKYHRWQKPQSVLERFIRATTDPGALVIDPFAGSGTSLLAARATGRRGLGCDVDDEAIASAIERGCDLV